MWGGSAAIDGQDALSSGIQANTPDSSNVNIPAVRSLTGNSAKYLSASEERTPKQQAATHCSD